jgi:thiamine pyrophosphokinase
MKYQRVVIIANGDLKEPVFYRGILEDNDYVICVNGGSIHALALGVRPHLVIGDLDSLPVETREKILKQKPAMVKHPPEKDKSDLELALDHAVLMQPAEILILGALGGARCDHAFINLLLLQIPFKNAIPAKIIDERQEILLAGEKTVVKGKPGDLLSLFALTDQVDGITTVNLKYPLVNETLHFASTRGLSNELLASSAEVTVGSGLLLVIKTTIN